MKDVLSEMAIFEKFGGRKPNPFFELLQGRFLINFAYRFHSPLGGLAETRVALGGAVSAIFLGHPVRNRNFYLWTRDVFAIGFRKNYDFAIDILTIFENASYNVLLHEKSVIFSFDHPSRPKWPLFCRK